MTENVSGERQDRAWAGILEAFCALGGAARNIVLGNDGRGLFVVEPSEAVLLRVPRRLLFRIHDIEFSDGRIGIRQSSDVPEPERQFFERYENTFSEAARTKSAVFITAMDKLPVEVRELLSTEFDLGALLQGDVAARIEHHFLHSRAVPWRGGPVIAPVLELANYGPEGFASEWGMHLQIQGFARNEITLRHSAQDALATFCRVGVAERQPVAFGLSMTIEHENGEIVIGRNTSAGVMRGKDRVPKVGVAGRTLALSYLMLGHKNTPRLPRGTFRSLLHEASIENSDEIFDQILRSNALSFIKLLQSLEPHEGQMISTLRTMARYQLEAMAHCVGSREPAPAPVPTVQA